MHENQNYYSREIGPENFKGKKYHCKVSIVI